MGQEYTTFMQRLLVVAPELRKLYDEHIEYYKEELLHILMGDITRLVQSLHCVATMASGELAADARGLAGRLLGFFEEAIQSPDRQVPDLIYASFLENLEEDDLLPSLAASMGPALQKALKESRQPPPLLEDTDAG